MSVTVDTNVLLYASNEEDPVHEEALALMSRLAQGPDLVYLFWPVLLGFMRIATRRGPLPKPLSPADAIANISAFISLPHVRVVSESEDFWGFYTAIARTDVRGNLVTDAWIAALMRANGVATIYTRDRGFKRFDRIQVVDPFDPVASAPLR